MANRDTEFVGGVSQQSVHAAKQFVETSVAGKIPFPARHLHRQLLGDTASTARQQQFPGRHRYLCRQKFTCDADTNVVGVSPVPCPHIRPHNQPVNSPASPMPLRHLQRRPCPWRPNPRRETAKRPCATRRLDDFAANHQRVKRKQSNRVNGP